MRSNILRGIIMICPLLIPFPPSCNMLQDEVGTELLRFRDCDVSSETERARWIIDGDQTLPASSTLAIILSSMSEVV